MVDDIVIAGIISAISAGAAGGGLIVSALSNKRQSKKQHLELLNELEKEIVIIERSRKTINEKAFLENYGNIHEKIAYLALNGIIEPKIALYFRFSFNELQKLLDNPEYREFKEDYTYIQEFRLKYYAEFVKGVRV
ncbi:hypothetical protein Nisw_06585 [Candidatus Nitrosopumilus sp. SW]|uniref:hypothetical protein n=1 Tax=Candidatus Nitrosopumilus sp. SW TaxID=2508726 RepID=UPI0011524B8F|nr:hypothetical protein [Candidatus Nitrosopumilus sp. SW]QDI89211.1 hypothetical protein Nisw_06585 [Candidatus Nitrosopumilus sp. SW]